MVKKHVPRRSWDFVLVWIGTMCTRTARLPDNRTGHEQVTGATLDISEWLDFSACDWMWFWDHPKDMANPKLGRWSDTLHQNGSDICHW